jgi:hypothetical protein
MHYAVRFLFSVICPIPYALCPFSTYFIEITSCLRMIYAIARLNILASGLEALQAGSGLGEECYRFKLKRLSEAIQ